MWGALACGPVVLGPVVGDPLYGRKRNGPGPESLKLFKRQALHAAVLEFIHPRTKQALSFATELPQDFKMLVESLGKAPPK